MKPGVYHIPCECGLVHIGICASGLVHIGICASESTNLFIHPKEHKTNCNKAELDKSVMAKHSWTYDHGIKLDEANVLVIDSDKIGSTCCVLFKPNFTCLVHACINQNHHPITFIMTC